MARYASAVKSASNTKAGGKKVVNHQGGTSFTLSAKEQLATFLLSQFMTGGFYETQNDQHARLVEMISNVDPVFAAKAAIYARDKFGMRTVTHVVGARLPQLVKGQPWMKNAISSMIVRPDDAVEMMAYHKSVITGPIPNALKKGVALGLRRFDGFQLDKWNKGGKFNLVDTVNLVTGGKKGRYRGGVVSANADALLKGELATADTWETRVSAAGKNSEVENAKEEAWADLVLTGKIAHMALLMNLRNIIQSADKLKNGDEVLDRVVELMSDSKRVAGSRVFPFRYITALDEIDKLSGSVSSGLINKAKRAINAALDISVTLVVPKFNGKTLVAVDDSGSMTGALIGGDRSVYRRVADVAAQLAGFIYKSNPDNTDVLFFNDSARWASLPNPDDTALSVVQTMRRNIGRGGGTYFNSIFKLAGSNKYDRIIILSDMQGADSISREIENYRKSQNAEVFIHSHDLVGYGTSMFPANQRLAKYAGFSDKVFNIMAQAEEDPKAMVREIEAIEIPGV